MYNWTPTDQAKSNESKGLELIIGHDEEVARWIVEQLPDPFYATPDFAAIGVARGGQITGGAIYTNYRTFDAGGATIEISCAGHGWLSRRVIGILLAYPFHQLGCHRVMSLVRKKNKASRRLLEGLGFRLEGVHPEAYGPRTGDCLSYGMLKRDNRWPFQGTKR